MAEKKKCPLMTGITETLMHEVPVFRECIEGECAWWADKFCVIRVLAGKLEDVRDAVRKIG